jgi:short-subunit dehydrogenase
MTTRSQTVVVTGASAGLGRAIANVFARTGARVGLISRDQAALEAAAAEVEDLGGSTAV